MENRDTIRTKALKIVEKAKSFEDKRDLFCAAKCYSVAQKIFYKLDERILAAKCLSYWVVAKVKLQYEGKDIERVSDDPIEFYNKKLVSQINSMKLMDTDKYEILIQAYKELEIVFHEKLLFSQENEMFFKESSLYHKLAWAKAKSKSEFQFKKKLEYFISGFNFFLHWFCGHGVKFGRSVISGLIVLIGFSFLFCCLNLIEFTSDAGRQINIVDSIYFSVVTIATVGYGDITPKGGWGRGLVTVEIVMGYFMLGVFMSLVINKVQKWK